MKGCIIYYTNPEIKWLATPTSNILNLDEVINVQTTVGTNFISWRGARPVSLFCIKESLEIRQGERCELGLSQDDSQNTSVVASESLTQNEETGLRWRIINL